MTKSRLVVVCECADSIEAETIRIRLDAADIRAIVTGTDSATALGLGGAGTMRLVRVEVDAADLDRARQLLRDDELKLQQAGPWVCSRCGEQNEAAFEVCWSCSKPRTGEDQQGRIDEAVRSDDKDEFESPLSGDPPDTARLDEDANPYRPVLMAADEGRAVSSNDHYSERMDPLAAESRASDATRCFRAAVVGVFVFPPLIGFYSLYLLLSIHGNAYRDKQSRSKLIIAWCINLIAIPSWLIFYRTQFLN